MKPLHRNIILGMVIVFCIAVIGILVYFALQDADAPPLLLSDTKKTFVVEISSGVLKIYETVDGKYELQVTHDVAGANLNDGFWIKNTKWKGVDADFFLKKKFKDKNHYSIGIKYHERPSWISNGLSESIPLLPIDKMP